MGNEAQSMTSMISMLNDRFLKKSSMKSMINDKVKISSPSRISRTAVEYGADRLVEKLQAPECRAFFCKVMYYVPEYRREMLLERALAKGVKSPAKYFVSSARREMTELGVK